MYRIVFSSDCPHLQPAGSVTRTYWYRVYLYISHHDGAIRFYLAPKPHSGAVYSHVESISLRNIRPVAALYIK